MSTLLRLTGNGGFAKLAAEPHGRARPAHEPETFLRENFSGASDSSEESEESEAPPRLELAPKLLLDQAVILDSAYEVEMANRERLKLITRRHVKTHNSWTHNHEGFVAGTRSTNYLYMHPDDASSRGLRHGDLVDVSSATAEVRIPMQLLPDLQLGTCAMAHGWGHQAATGLGVASKTSGVNVNLLAADGPDHVEALSGMARLTGILIEVRPASGEQNVGHWSGRPSARVGSAD
jgi:anaerobic selenocysteine-containing dehydrogenase